MVPTIKALGASWKRGQKDCMSQRLEEDIWTQLDCCTHELRAVMVACTRLSLLTLQYGEGAVYEILGQSMALGRRESQFSLTPIGWPSSSRCPHAHE